VADRAHGLGRGADAYLAEPIEPEELLATVTAALRYYRARRRAERTAARLARLTRVTLAINAAETFSRLGRTAPSCWRRHWLTGCWPWGPATGVATIGHQEWTQLVPDTTFTGGLVEDRGGALDDNLERLRVAALDASDTSLDALNDRILELFGRREDDVALIALRR
jgi:hypothetical protein